MSRDESLAWNTAVNSSAAQFATGKAQADWQGQHMLSVHRYALQSQCQDLSSCPMGPMRGQANRPAHNFATVRSPLPLCMLRPPAIVQAGMRV